MEKKTIGGFISTLRKANGMTQKELAERLNVSDKTISRWERDDGAPDLALIPVIAEIFNVTYDELLRGERKSPTERAEMLEDKEISPKGEMIWSAHNLSSFYGITFDDYDSFVEYMEQDIPADIYETNYNGTVTIPVLEEQLGDPAYYDEYGNEISEEEALTREIEGRNGNTVCTYIQRNQNVSNIRYTAKNGTVLPIQVIMTEDYRTAVKMSNFITTVYCVLYPIELFIVLLVYFKNRREYFK